MKKTIPPSSREEPDIEEEERELFLNAFYQNISLQDKKEHAKHTPSRREENPASRDNQESDQELFLRAINEGGFFSQPRSTYQKDTKPPPKNARRRDKIDGAIDLHGLFADEAVERLLHFIAREKNRGSRTLLIVHGKGSGVLKNTVWSIAETNPLIENWQVAPGKYGGQGALIVHLKRKQR